MISIHAPLAGCDAGAMWRRADDGYFNPRTPRGVRLVLLMSDNGTPEISIHALLAGCDEGHLDPAQLEEIFQSTRPMRGATAMICSLDISREFQSTRPMRGATAQRVILGKTEFEFQSTRPMRGATKVSGYADLEDYSISIHAPHAGRDRQFSFLILQDLPISIHAPHAGRDDPAVLGFFPPPDFNPRAPCGARRRWPPCSRRSRKFQSTRPVRGAT